jgi:hypothetical protein
MSEVKIVPTVGRVVWYRPARNEGAAFACCDDQPLAALIARVWTDSCVNLTVFDANGHAHSRTSVPLLQADEAKPEGGFYAEWMPYQVGQAKKHVPSEEPSVKIEHPSGSSITLSAREATFTVAGEASEVPDASHRSLLRKLRIVSDGRLTRVYDFESGDEVKLVQSLRLEHHVGGRMYARVETLQRAESFDIVADGEIRVVAPTLTPDAGPVWPPRDGCAKAEPVKGSPDAALAERGASDGLAVV